MTSHELELLQLVANGELLFHKGTWGGLAGFRWRGPDGTEAGIVPPWECDALDGLAGRGLIAIDRRLGPSDCRVRPTHAGLAALSGLAHAA